MPLTVVLAEQLHREPVTVVKLRSLEENESAVKAK